MRFAVLRLEDAPQEVDSLVKRVEGIFRVQLGPQVLGHLLPTGGESVPRDQKTQQSQDLSPNSAPVEHIVSDSDAHAAEILDENWNREEAGKTSTCGCRRGITA